MVPCAHQCINLNGSFDCPCFDGYTRNKTSCEPLIEPKTILYATNHQIKEISDFKSNKTVNFIDIEKFPIVDIDFNVDRKTIIYALKKRNEVELWEMDIENTTDKTLNTLKKSTKGGFAKLHSVLKITHDWITRNTYVAYFDGDMRVKIIVCNTAKISCANILSLHYDETITAMRVDPINKFIFLAKMRDTSKIVRVKLDGSDPKMIAKDAIIKSMAIDVEQQRVYYTETLSQTLFSVDYSGKNSRKLIAFSEMIKRPIAMTLFKNHALILQRASKIVTRCKLYGLMECHKFEMLVKRARQFAIGYSLNQKMVRNGCERNFCEVDDYCIPMDIGYKCLDFNGTLVG